MEHVRGYHFESWDHPGYTVGANVPEPCPLCPIFGVGSPKQHEAIEEAYTGPLTDLGHVLCSCGGVFLNPVLDLMLAVFGPPPAPAPLT